MSSELITVVTVSYNEGDNLLKTMESVMSQTYRPLEYIVIDGGSTDGSYERAMSAMVPKAEEAGIMLKGVSEPDKGIYDGMNKGAAMATGKYVNFMNAGDRFYDDDTIRRFFSHEAVEGAAIIYGDYLRQKDYAALSCMGEPPEVIGRRMPTSHQAIFINTMFMKKYPYDTAYKIAADFDFVHKMYKMGEKICHIPDFVAVCEAVQGLSSRHMVMMHKECDRIVGIPLTPGRRMKYALKSMERNIIGAFNALLPRKLLNKIRKMNRRRLENRRKSKA